MNGSIADRVSVLGVDSSLRGLGYALGCGELPIHEGWQSTQAVQGVRARIERYDTLCAPVLELARQYSPRVALIEGYAFSQNGQGARWLAELGGILRRELFKHCEQVIEVSNNQLRKFATGYGGRERFSKDLDERQLAQQKRQRSKDGKRAVASGLRDLYGRPFDEHEDGWNDRADAHTLVRIGLALCGVEQPRTEAQREVVESIQDREDERMASAMRDSAHAVLEKRLVSA